MLRRGRKYQITFAMFLLSVFGMVHWLQEDVPFFLCWGGSVFFAFVSFRLRQVRCPSCGRVIHQYWQHFKYCPYCGEGLEK